MEDYVSLFSRPLVSAPREGKTKSGKEYMIFDIRQGEGYIGVFLYNDNAFLYDRVKRMKLGPGSVVDMVCSMTTVPSSAIKASTFKKMIDVCKKSELKNDPEVSRYFEGEGNLIYQKTYFSLKDIAFSEAKGSKSYKKDDESDVVETTASKPEDNQPHIAGFGM